MSCWSRDGARCKSPRCSTRSSSPSTSSLRRSWKGRCRWHHCCSEWPSSMSLCQPFWVGRKLHRFFFTWTQKNLPMTSLSGFISTSASSYHQRWLLLIREVWHNFLERPKNRFRDDWTDHSYVERKKNLQTLDQKSFEMKIDWGGLACWVRRRSSKWRPWVRGPPLWRFGPQRWEKGHWFRKKKTLKGHFDWRA